MGDKQPKSPCVKRCKIDKDSGLCVGCWRTPSEISDWKRLSAMQRERVLQAIELRRTSAKTNVEVSRPRKTSQPRKALSKALCRLLADTHALALKAHGLRWNLEEPLSAALGPLLDEQRAELGDAADQLAHRIRVLGAPVLDSVSAVRRLGSLQRAGKRARTARAMIRQYARDQATTARAARAILATAESAEDGASAQLLALRVQAHDRAAKALCELIRQRPAPQTV